MEPAAAASAMRLVCFTAADSLWWRGLSHRYASRRCDGAHEAASVLMAVAPPLILRGAPIGRCCVDYRDG